MTERDEPAAPPDCVPGLIFREATEQDAALLLSWRNDPLTRQASFSSEPITRADHLAWLRRAIASQIRSLLIAELDHQPIGSVRLDQLPNGRVELSWTVAPEHRRRGLGAALVRQAVEITEGNVVARIKADNVASRKIAERAGLVLQAAEEDHLLFASEGSP